MKEMRPQNELGFYWSMILYTPDEENEPTEPYEFDFFWHGILYTPNEGNETTERV